LSKIFTVGDLHFRLKMRRNFRRYNREKKINYFLCLNKSKVRRNYKKKKYFFFKYKVQSRYNNKFINKFFKRKPFLPKFLYKSDKSFYYWKRHLLLIKNPIKSKIQIKKSKIQIKSLIIVKKMIRKFKKRIKRHMIFFRGSNRKKILIRQSMLKFKKYKTLKLFMVSSIYSRIARSRHSFQDVRRLQLRKNKVKS